jgi:hypothetical protein
MTLTSCGFLNDTPVEDQDLYISRDPLGPQCELDPDRFARIFEEDILDQITCLRENFDQFSRFVITQNPDSVDQTELSLFIRKFFASNSQTILKALNLMFELNMVMLRDHASTLSRDNVDAIAELMIEVNKEAINITRIFRAMTGPDRDLLYPQAREDLLQAMQRLSSKTVVIIKRTGRNPQTLNLKKFIIDLERDFDISNNIIDEQLVESLLFVKKVLVGGERDQINSDEVITLIEKSPNLVIEFFDFIFAKASHFNDSEADLRRFYQQKITNLHNLIHPLELDHQLFTETDLFVIYDAVVRDDESIREQLDLYRFKPLIQSFKKNILGGAIENYNVRDFRSLFLAANMAFEGTLFFDQFKALTDDIKLITPAEVLKRRDDFEQLFTKLGVELTKRQQEIITLPESFDLISFVKTIDAELDEINIGSDLLGIMGAFKIHFLGGETEVFSRAQWDLFQQDFSKFAKLYYDLYYLLPVVDATDLSIAELLEEVVHGLETLPRNPRTTGTFLTRAQLQTLMKEVIPDLNQRARYQNLIDSFTTNILRSSPLELTVEDYKKLLNYGKTVIEGIDFYPFHQDQIEQFKNRPQDFQQIKTAYLARFNQLLNEVERLASIPDLIQNEIYYQDFLFDMAIVFDEFELDQELVDDFSPLKTILLGGRQDTLSKTEALALIQRLRVLVPWALDFIYGPSELKDEMFFVRFMKVFKEQVYDITSDDQIITLDHLLKVASRFVDLPIVNFQSTLAILKQKIIGGQANLFTGRDLGRILSLISDFFDFNAFSEITYTMMSSRLDNTRTPITLIPAVTSPLYSELNPAKLNTYRELFADVVQKHRYYRNPTDHMQNWGHEIYRNKSGFKELATLKWGISLIVEAWGSPTPGAYKGYALSLDELEQLLVDAKPILEEFGLWTAHFDTFARNTMLLGDLFQNRSNGDQRLDVDELAEYGLMVLSAIELNNQFMTRLTEYCPPLSGSGPDDWSFNTPCYRPHFFRIIMQEFDYARYLPMLNRYAQDNPSSEVTTFLRNVEGFARDVDDEAIPMVRRDFILLIGALINIETTFLRFDVNRDNIVDPNELKEAFKIYEKAIILIAELDEGSEKYAESIFLYMIRNNSIPSRTQVVYFHYSPFVNRDISALRINIGSLLYNLVNN